VKNQQQEIFETRARNILNYLNAQKRYDRDFFKPPFIVEFTGSPSSGKTTTIKQMYNFLRRHGFQVLIPQEGAEVIPARLRKSPDYNIQTGLYALKILLAEREEHRHDVILFDRCLFDACHWMKYWMEQKKLSKKEAVNFVSFFSSERFTRSICLAYIMICDQEIAVKRENEVAPSDKLGETTNPASIEEMVHRFTAMHRKLSPRFPQLRLVDTTKLNKKEMVLRVGSEILEILEEKSL